MYFWNLRSKYTDFDTGSKKTFICFILPRRKLCVENVLFLMKVEKTIPEISELQLTNVYNRFKITVNYRWALWTLGWRL